MKGSHVAGIILLVAGIGCWALSGESYYEDEQHHYPQIRRFMQGNTGELSSTMLPGYHVVLATFGHLSGVDSLDGMRRFTLVLSLLSSIRSRQP